MEKVRVAVVKVKLLGPGAKGRVDIEKVRMTVEKVKIMNTQKWNRISNASGWWAQILGGKLGKIKLIRSNQRKLDAQECNLEMNLFVWDTNNIERGIKKIICCCDNLKHPSAFHTKSTDGSECKYQESGKCLQNACLIYTFHIIQFKIETKNLRICGKCLADIHSQFKTETKTREYVEHSVCPCALLVLYVYKP